jgi:hypothetical protein
MDGIGFLGKAAGQYRLTGDEHTVASEDEGFMKMAGLKSWAIPVIN